MNSKRGRRATKEVDIFDPNMSLEEAMKLCPFRTVIGVNASPDDIPDVVVVVMGAAAAFLEEELKIYVRELELGKKLLLLADNGVTRDLAKLEIIEAWKIVREAKGGWGTDGPTEH